MKVYVFPADTHGCGHYRMIWPAEAAKREGIDVVLKRPNERDEIHARVANGVVVDVIVPKDADVIVFQRVTHRYLAQAIPIIRSNGIGVVIDMDDDLSSLSPHNSAFHAMHPKGVALGKSDHSWKFAEFACDNATVVTVSADALLSRYARNTRGIVINNYLHDAVFQINPSNSSIFGYPGAISTHWEDVSELGFAPGQLMREGFKFSTIGDDSGIVKMLSLPREVDLPRGPVTLSAWPAALSTLGIGFAPLKDTLFNKSKSWLKPLELAGAGTHCIMSSSPEYRRIAKLGIGEIATKPRDFYRKTRMYLSNDALREDRGMASREIAQRMTISQHVDEWISAWKIAYESR